MKAKIVDKKIMKNLRILGFGNLKKNSGFEIFNFSDLKKSISDFLQEQCVCWHRGSC